MSTSLLELMDELLQAMEQRDAGDPDAPVWEATARIARLEDEIARRLSDAEAERSLRARTAAEASPAEAAAVIA